ncbi:hypothetical protein D9M71_610280 [compost metagenome]
MPPACVNVAMCVSLRSTSLKTIVPLAVSESVVLAVVSASSVTVPACSPRLIVTPSFTPENCTVAVAQLSVPLPRRIA